MIHQPMGGAQGQASDIEITTREILKLKRELYTIIADHSGNNFEKVEKDGDRDYWMTSQEAKQLRFQFGVTQAHFTRKQRTRSERVARRKMQKASRRRNRGLGKGQRQSGRH